MKRFVSSVLFAVAAAVAPAALAAPLPAAAVEGIYDAVLGHEHAVLTVARAAPDQLVVGLQTEYLGYGMTYVSYDPATGHLQGWTFPDDDDGSRGDDYWIDLTFAPGGTVSGQMFGGTLWTVSARLAQPLTDYFGKPAGTEGPVGLDGTYDGELLGYPFRLVIGTSARGPWAIGTFYTDGRATTAVQFLIVSQAREQNVVYLTSRNGGGPFIQIRAQLSRGQLEGEYIVGGRAVTHPFSLTPR